LVIIRTPLRITFFGGGTDYPFWFSKNSGIAINATINKFSYVSLKELPPFHPYKYLIRYYLREEEKKISDIKHPVVRGLLGKFNYDQGLDLVHHADLPARTGLGSSSVFTVGLLHALYSFRGTLITKERLASEAIHFEQNVIKEAVGSQDQISASYGGFNVINFRENGTFSVKPAILKKDNLKIIEDNLFLCYTGLARNAADIAADQIRNKNNNVVTLNEISEIARQGEKLFSSPRVNIKELGSLLDYQWQLKKNLSTSVSNDVVDKIYSIGMKNGAYGGKLLGAGGGGFVLFLVKRELQEDLRKKLGSFLHVPIKFESRGSELIYMD
tara:strand:- start:132524 stop:133507 length:984 start_codon:yes stop_codon:yes gene_type:complete